MLSVFESTLVPGLLQTEGYVRALLSAGRPAVSQSDIDRRVQFRIERQAILRREKPPSYIAVLDEAVLRRPVGTIDTMREQLQYLINSSERAHITIHVVPFSSGAYVGQDGAFSILGFTEPHNPDVVYIESPAGNLYLEEPETVQRKIDAFNRIRQAALNKQETSTFIRTIITELLREEINS